MQLVAFGVFRAFGGSRSPGSLTGWGLGALLRLIALVVYGFVADRVLGLPLAPALLSLAAFFFITTLIESLLLQRVHR